MEYRGAGFKINFAIEAKARVKSTHSQLHNDGHWKLMGQRPNRDNITEANPTLLPFKQLVDLVWYHQFQQKPMCNPWVTISEHLKCYMANRQLCNFPFYWHTFNRFLFYFNIFPLVNPCTSDPFVNLSILRLVWSSGQTHPSFNIHCLRNFCRRHCRAFSKMIFVNFANDRAPLKFLNKVFKLTDPCRISAPNGKGCARNISDKLSNVSAKIIISCVINSLILLCNGFKNLKLYKKLK